MLQFSATKIVNAVQGPITFDVSFQLAQGQLMALYGNSGVGKTTLLRILAGLTNADNAIIQFNNHCWHNSAKRIYLKTQYRSIGFVFQDYALFPNFNVRQNIAFGASPQTTPSAIDQVLEIMELHSLQHLKIHQLSGGQKQRIALARAIVRQPKLLLLDEAFSALDNQMRLKMQAYLLKVHQQLQCTTILVSHSITEIIQMADAVCCLDNGQVTHFGNPLIVFQSQVIQNNQQLVGEVISVHKGQQLDPSGADPIQLVVRINNALFQLTVPSTEVENYHKGMQLNIQAKFLPSIKPIAKAT